MPRVPPGSPEGSGCVLAPAVLAQAGPTCWIFSGVYGGAGFPSIFDGKKKTAGSWRGCSQAVVAVGSPLAARLPGPTGITLHHALFPSVCHRSVWLAHLSSSQPPCPTLPPSLGTLGWAPELLRELSGELLGLSLQHCNGSFLGFSFILFPSSCQAPFSHCTPAPELLQAILVLAVPSHLISFLHRFTGVLCQMSHWGTLCFLGCHWPVLLWGSTVLWLWARSPHRHRAAHRDLLLQKLPGL